MAGTSRSVASGITKCSACRVVSPLLHLPEFQPIDNAKPKSFPSIFPNSAMQPGDHAENGSSNLCHSRSGDCFFRKNAMNPNSIYHSSAYRTHLVCEYCQGTFEHERWCPTKEPKVCYAYQIAS